ncbi:PAS domain-containing hybrid sensor histidine kinase/response regulator [Pseudomonas sp. dw_358]|uniref:two-component system sensor histidine kinase NtrB n=1 Tax=Pseudomonas sp. dw_358 TaxID=2720083 RepID=UPI001BD35F64|nr:PAS domain-containing hybrid sensor histidine kinase/response regulator [Pseudomonas sp. dw_358]
MKPNAPFHAAAEHQHRFELLVQSVMDHAIYMLDLDGHIVTWNTGAQRIKGYVSDDVIGRHFATFFTPEDVADGKPQRLLTQAYTQGHGQDEGWRVRRDGSRFWAKVGLDLIRDEQGQPIGFAKVTRDISERHEAERQLDQVRAELFQAQKLEALGQLTGGLAHDFNNLLTIILSSARMARKSQNPTRIDALLGHIVDAGERGTHLTRQLLTFARHKEAGHQRLDISQMLVTTQALLAQALPKRISLSVLAEPGLHAVDADPSQLEMVLLNLTLNARDAIVGDGRIEVTAVNLRLREEAPGLTGEFVRISVADTGAGIDAQTRQRIFEPFFTTKAFGQGTGLGLSQAYGFARHVNGDLRVDSVVGVGTTMHLLIPAASA